jgi:hypothetical protein
MPHIHWGVYSVYTSHVVFTVQFIFLGYSWLYYESIKRGLTIRPINESTCKQLVWSTRIGRNMSIWILCLILGSAPGANLPLEVTGPCSRVIGTWSPRSSAYRTVCSPSVDIPTPRTHVSAQGNRGSRTPSRLPEDILKRNPHWSTYNI